MPTRIIGNTTFVDRTDFVLDQVARNIEDSMQDVADLLVEAVQEKILYGYHDVHGLPDNPHTEIVDTGALFDSIKAAVTRDSQNAFTTAVGSDLPYAIYPHDGTRFLKGRPYLTDAVTEKRDDIEAILSTGVPRGIV